MISDTDHCPVSVIHVKPKLGEGTGQESGPLYASWQGARAQSGLLRRPLSISMGGHDPPDPLDTGLPVPAFCKYDTSKNCRYYENV